MKSKWFEKKLVNGMIYIPKNIIDKLKLKGNDKIAVTVIQNNIKITFPARISQYFLEYCSFRIFKLYEKFLKNNEISRIRVEKLYTLQNKPNTYDDIDLRRFNKYLNKSSISNWNDPNKVVLWHEQVGKKGRPLEPIVINRKIVMTDELAKYLGLYFAEGNNTEHYRIYASTKELSQLVIKNYESIIKDPRLTLIVNLTRSANDLRSDDEIENSLINYWKDLIYPYKIKNIEFIKPKSEFSGPEERLEFGTLMISDTRIFVRYLHQWLIKEILVKRNIRNLRKFFEGAACGDISVGIDSRSNGFSYFEIATNKLESKIWEKICKFLKLKYRIYYRSGKSAVIQIRGYVDCIKFLKSGIYNEYPKRRSKLIYGIKNRIETYLLQTLWNSHNHSIKINGCFGVKIGALLAHKGGDLTKNKLIKINNKMVLLTEVGKKFTKELIIMRCGGE